MRKIPLTDEELTSTCAGEAITLAGVLAIMSIAIIAVIIYKLFMKETGKVKLPGGYSFERK